MNREDLIAFEDDIANEFNAGKIPYPVHLSSGNETQLLDIFEYIRPDDWVLGSWRSHYHCLLKGVPSKTLKKAIMEGRSIALSFPEYRVYCSAIVGGIAPIALGIAMGTKRAGKHDLVYCFLGDMTAETGIAHECIKYARNYCLPVCWIVEDNSLSVCTDTKVAWAGQTDWNDIAGDEHYDTLYYQYHSKYPHAGAGKRVEF